MIYFARITEGDAIKIGYSNNVDARLLQLEKYYGCPLTLLATLPGGFYEEREIRKRFHHLNLGVELGFRKLEQFRPGSDLMEFIGLPDFIGVDPDSVQARKPVNGWNGVGDEIKVVSLNLNNEDYSKVDRLAKRLGVSIPGLVRMVLKEHLKETQSSVHDPALLAAIEAEWAWV